MASLLQRLTTWANGQVLTAPNLNSEFDNIVNLLNNLDSTTTKWDQVSVLNATSVPLTSDNGAGTNLVARFKVNGTDQVWIDGSGRLVFNSGLLGNKKVVTSGASYTILSTDCLVIINKTVGSATAVTLPGAAEGTILIVKDGKGDAATNNITISTGAGASLETGTTYVISVNFGWVMLWCDTSGTGTWRVVGQSSSGYVTASQTTFTNFAATGTFGNIVSMTIPSGVWDLTGQMAAQINAATTSGHIQLAISAFSGNTTTDHVGGDNLLAQLPPTASGGNSNSCITIANWRVSITTAATYYLKGLANYSAGNPQYVGRFSAVRVG